VIIEGSVAVVTGAASGLGRATALLLAELGADVVAVDRDRPTDDQPTHERIVDVEADVTDAEQVARAIDTAASLGPVRVAVNCAGVATPGRVLRDGRPLDLAAFRAVLDVNVVGTVNVLSRAAVWMAQQDMIEGERGVVVNTSSVAAYDGQIGQVGYAAAKAAVAGMTLPLARELAAVQVRVVALAPGMFETPLLAGLPTEAIRSLSTQVPHPSRLGRPYEFAQLVAQVIENQMINGEVIRIDGAIRMAPR